MREPRILRSAWEDLAEIADHLAYVSGARTAEETADAILDTIGLLCSMPYLGPLHHDSVLQRPGYCKLARGTYVCACRVIYNVPTVYRAFHERQNYAWRLM